MKDLYKIIAFIKVYQNPVFGKLYFNIDHGKNNLESYFIPKGWTKNRIKKAVKQLKECGAVSKEKADNPNLYSLSFLHKLNLKLI